MHEFDTFPRHLEFYSNSPLEAEVEDDVANSGIFSNHKANVHVGDGVFSANYALPGYAQRENLLGRSEVIDRQTGTNIEVYVGGATSAAQFMPSTQPRYPWPDRDGFLGGAVNKARMQDDGQYPVQDISDMPADFLGPVTNTTREVELWPLAVDQARLRGQPRGISGLGSFTDGLPEWAILIGTVALGAALGFAAKRYL